MDLPGHRRFNFAVEASDIVVAIRRAGGSFKAAGGQVEELIALFTSVRGTTRETAETIATGFRTIFTRLQRPTTIKFLRQFGVELTDLEGKFVGVLLLLVGAFAWSLGMVMAKPISKKIGGLAVTAWVCLFAGPLLLLGSFIFDGNTINYLSSADLKGWSIVAFLGLIMQPIAYGTWYHVMGRNPVHKVMPVMLLLPLTGLLTAIFLLGEEPTKQVFFGGAIILFGIGMILFSKPKKRSNDK